MTICDQSTTTTQQAEADHAWQMRMVSAMALRMGFRDDEIEDAQQEVALQLLSVELDPERSTHGTVSTMVAVIARNVLSNMRRSSMRYRGCIDRYATLCPQRETVEFAEQQTELWDLIATADEPTQRVAALLAQGESPTAIARTLGFKWERVRRIMDELNRLLCRHGWATQV